METRRGTVTNTQDKNKNTSKTMEISPSTKGIITGGFVEISLHPILHIYPCNNTFFVPVALQTISRKKKKKGGGKEGGREDKDII